MSNTEMPVINIDVKPEQPKNSDNPWGINWEDELKFDTTYFPINKGNKWQDFWFYLVHELDYLAMFFGHHKHPITKKNRAILFVSSLCFLLAVGQYSTEFIISDCMPCSQFDKSFCESEPLCIYQPYSVTCDAMPQYINNTVYRRSCQMHELKSNCEGLSFCKVVSSSSNWVCQLRKQTYIIAGKSPSIEADCRTENFAKTMGISILLGFLNTILTMMFVYLVKFEFARPIILTISLVSIPITLVVPLYYQFYKPFYLKEPYLYKTIWSQYASSIASMFFSDLLVKLGLFLFSWESDRDKFISEFEKRIQNNPELKKIYDERVKKEENKQQPDI